MVKAGGGHKSKNEIDRCWDGTMAPLAVFREDLTSTPSTTWQLTTACSSNASAAHALSVSLLALHRPGAWHTEGIPVHIK